MRPPGEIRQALLEGVRTLATTSHGPTLRELAAHTQVGTEAAAYTLDNLRRAGLVRSVRERRVDYRNRPVAEYEPALAPAAAADDCTPPMEALRSFWETPLATTSQAGLLAGVS
jgi:hypothetical protein